jgi:hypothetical protein
MTTGRINQVTIICLVDWKCQFSSATQTEALLIIHNVQPSSLTNAAGATRVFFAILESDNLRGFSTNAPSRQAPHLHLPTWVLPQRTMEKHSYIYRLIDIAEASTRQADGARSIEPNAS